MKDELYHPYKVGTTVKTAGGTTGVIIARTGMKWARVRIDNHPTHPLGQDGKGWLLPTASLRLVK